MTTILVKSGSDHRTQRFSSDYDADASQRLVDAVHGGDTDSAIRYIDNPLVDVNFIGTARLRSKTTEIVSRDESPHEVRFAYEEFNTEVTPLFLAAHNGNLMLLRNLLVSFGQSDAKGSEMSFSSTKRLDTLTSDFLVESMTNSI